MANPYPLARMATRHLLPRLWTVDVALERLPQHRPTDPMIDLLRCAETCNSHPSTRCTRLRWHHGSHRTNWLTNNSTEAEWETDDIRIHFR